MRGEGIGASVPPLAALRSAPRSINCSYSSQFINRAHLNSLFLIVILLNARGGNWCLRAAFGSTPVSPSLYKLLLFVAVYKQSSPQFPLSNSNSFKCAGRELNPHGLHHTPLKRARLPIPPPARELFTCYKISGIAFFIKQNI